MKKLFKDDTDLGEKMKKAGSKGSPTAKQFRRAALTAKK
jgi:hypothetical protein